MKCPVCKKPQAEELLKAYHEQGLPDDFGVDGLTIVFNLDNGNVFFTNSAHQIARCNGDKLVMEEGKMTPRFVKCSYSQNYDLGKTQITDNVRVSSAALWREEFGGYFLVETWCFSEDPRQRSFQIIHGTPAGSISANSCEVEDAWKIHQYVVAGLRRKLCIK